jgi:hypothetical protein
MAVQITIDAARDRALADRGLPEHAYRFEPEVGIVLIRRGIAGYSVATNAPVGLEPEQAEIWVALQNARMGVSPAQAEAMFAGSAFGWHVPLADPAVVSSLRKESQDHG